MSERTAPRLEMFQPEHRCPKCGDAAAWTYVPALPSGHQRRLWAERNLITQAITARPTPDEYLRRDCQGCGYVWAERPMDSSPREPLTGGGA